MTITLCGIDGVKGGWISATASLDAEKITGIQLSFHPTLLSPFFQKIQLAAIDMPIGLPKQTRKGGRLAEKQARPFLKKRASSLFSTPCRSTLSAQSYAEALSLSRASGPDGLGLSIQSYNILPKIKVLDALLQEDIPLRERIYESHPELAFSAMHPQTEFQSKYSSIGRSQRMAALRSQDCMPNKWLEKYPMEDQLDALACLWSARRIHLGLATMVPNPPPYDETGLRMAICW